jgi:hypothetical protein
MNGGRCIARTTSTGSQCKNPAIRGTTVCRYHGGSNKATARKALVRAELSDWGLNDQKVDPGEVLLRLVSQSARRTAFYGELLRQAYEAEDTPAGEFELPHGVRALIGVKRAVDSEGHVTNLGEEIRGLVALELAERKLCADFSMKAISAGLAERQVRVAEIQGAAIIGAIMVALDRAGIVGPARLEAQNAAADYLMEIEA